MNLLIALMIAFAASAKTKVGDYTHNGQRLARNEIPFRAMFPPPNPQCAKSLDKIDDQLDYYYNLWLHDETVGKRTINPTTALNPIYTQLEKDERNGCFDYSATYYALRAVWDKYPESERGELVVALLLFLKHEGKLVPISHSGRNAMGGAWAKKMRNGKPLVYGAYDCTEGKIYFDPYRGEMDLDGVIVHELDHLFRDKLIQGWDQNLSVQESLLLDESLAAMSAAHTETVYYPRYKGKVGVDEIPFSGDITLFSQTGDMVYLTLSLVRHIGSANTDATNLRSLMVDYADESEGEGGSVGRRLLNIVNTIGESYFKNYSPINRSWKDIRGAHEDALDPMHLLDKRFGLLWADTTGRSDPYLKDIAKNDSAFWSHAFDDGEIKGFKPLMTDLLMELREALTYRSYSCQRFTNALERGQLENYLGSEVPVPSGDGKPGNDGSKPGNDGSKPGNDGSKPGNDGSKPATGIKPCVAPSAGI